jgi:hypothetical protein
MIQAPWLGAAPSSPVIDGIDTFAIVMSSTSMRFASARTSVRMTRIPPV